MDPALWIPSPCAVCGRRTKRSALSLCNPLQYKLSLLTNPYLPPETLPTTYNLAAYEGAILCPSALTERDRLAPFDICGTCASSWKNGHQPVNALANFQYYARDELPLDVRKAFADASLYDLMMTAHCRCTRITHLFSDKGREDPVTDGTDQKKADQRRLASQGYSKGNVAIFPQDIATLRSILPPPRQEIHEAMCALFVGASTVPTKDNIKALRPVLVSKTRVQLILDFLINRNSFYAAAGVTFSQENLDAIFEGTDDEGIPDGVELCCLPDSSLEPDTYADRGTGTTACAPGMLNSSPAPVPHCIDADNTVMEAVGYVVGERTPKDIRDMKASAVAWCLDKNNYVKMQAGSTFLSDRDPGFLTFCFPALDPWGIGAFHEPNR
ncbi:hypothetical protein K438DRAFT_1616647, partial [Mycena galopus ATCC 62051]